MQNQFQRKKGFSIFYTILAIVDFSYTLCNRIRNFLLDDDVLELCIPLGRKLLYLLPLFAFIYVSKKAAVTEELQNRLKIKMYVKIYLALVLVFGVVEYPLNRLCNWHLPIFPSCLLYSSSWMFSLEYVIKYHSAVSVFSLILDVCFWVISIMFMKNLSKEITHEEEFKQESGKTSTGYMLGVVNIVLLPIQTVLNVSVAFMMHENMSGVSGEHALGAAFFVLILIGAKLLLDFILLPVIPLSIIGIVKSCSKKEIEQERKNRLLGKRINIVCLVIASLELILV